MKNKTLSAIALLLSLIILATPLTACKGSTPDQNTEGKETVSTETKSAESQTTETKGFEATDSKDSETEESTGEAETAEKSDGPIRENEADATFTIPAGEYGEAIANANGLWGGVNVYYEDGTRQDLTVSNDSMALTIHAAADGNAMIGSIKNPSGKSYVENTMDVYVKMANGSTYYSSSSVTPMVFDMYRLGMYYYELRAEKQTFINKYNEYASKDLGIESASTTRFYEMTVPKLVDGAIKTKMTGKSDPRIYYDHTSFSTDEYNYLAVDVKVTSVDPSYQRALTVFAWITGVSSPVAETTVYVANDGEFHTYYFKLDSSNQYKNSSVREFRFDFAGIIGDTFEYKNVRAVKADIDGAPDLHLCRYFHTYTDKYQQVVQVTARTATEGIEEIGMITKLDKNTVNAVIVKDKSGIHSSIDGVDWASVEYVGFDVKDAGIFGYILLPDSGYALAGTTQILDSSSGNLTVTLEGDNYVIVQSKAPNDNKLLPAGTSTTIENFDNRADFYMGHRIYTDEGHDFATFIKEAELERHPLDAKNISVVYDENSAAKYLGYDNLRGVYVFSVNGSNFSRPYYQEPNRHFAVNFTVKGDEYERNMYVMSTTTHGELQCAVVLSDNDLLLPIPVEVGKNFSDGGESIYDAKDEPWSEAYFPVRLDANEEKSFKFLNIYQNWGQVPLKQISFIQLAPLYHISTGVTETNCILPWYSNMGGIRNIWTLPDHRAMSAPFWVDQPNHTSGGDHLFLRYTDSEGNYCATEQKSNYITSYGPTYAEVVLNYLSDDGKIAVTYTHMEMPQTDETRTYYTMEYKVLEDISFNNFKDDFIFYSMNPFANVNYMKIGYLDENNESVVRDIDRKGRTRYYVLGDECPYFSYYNDPANKLAKGYVNLSFMIYESEFIMGGERVTPNFILKEESPYLYLSLNLEEVHLKAGDTFKINCILMPWGSQESDYTLEDKNVRDVRLHSLLDPLTATAVEGCSVVKTDFLPRLRVTDGKSATFTLSGGENNSTVQIDGFTKLSIPEVYEKIDGEWVRYNLSSQYTPDKSGYGQAYDGYGVQYKSDGTYSYSFVVNMGDGEMAPRTFKIIVSDTFTPEAKPEGGEDQEIEPAGPVDGPNLMLDAKTLYTKSSKAGANKALEANSKVMQDPDGTEYFRFCAKDGQSEAWIMPYTLPADPIATGQYLTIKFRLPVTMTKLTRFEIWTSTFDATPLAGSCFSYYKDFLVADGKWHVVTIDLSRISAITFEPAENGSYYANYLRFDLFDSGYENGSFIDIQYISFDDRATDIFAYPENADFSKIVFYDGRLLEVSTTETDFPLPKTVYEDDTTAYETPYTYYVSPKKLAYKASNTTDFGNVSYYEDGDFVRFNSHMSLKESDFSVFYNKEPVETGRYLIMKYRASETLNTYMQFYATTLSVYDANNNPDGKRAFTESNSVSLSNTNFVRDGEWQIVVIDLASMTKEFTADENGSYSCTWLRFDVFNSVMGTTAEYVDVAYIAMCDDLQTAITSDRSVDSALVRLSSAETRYYSTETGKVK